VCVWKKKEEKGSCLVSLENGRETFHPYTKMKKKGGRERERERETVVCLSDLSERKEKKGDSERPLYVSVLSSFSRSLSLSLYRFLPFSVGSE